jgi:hypothetical protein
MSDYTPIVNFAAKDVLITGNPAKAVLGAELTAEYTAIATAISSKWDSGNDGAGSTLDADLLDAQQGAYYLAWANFTGVPSTFTPSSHTHVIADTTGLQTAINAKLDSSSYTAADVLSKLLTVDGPASGLDADTLDGVSSASFAQLGSAANFTAGLQTNGVDVGYKQIPRSTTATTATTADVGKCIAITAGIAIPTSTFAAGDALTIYNDSAGTLVITSTATMRLAGGSLTGSRNLAQRGIATIWFNSATECVIFGAGVT